jgi:hypothetical protein
MHKQSLGWVVQTVKCGISQIFNSSDSRRFPHAPERVDAISVRVDLTGESYSPWWMTGGVKKSGQTVSWTQFMYACS